MLVRPRNSTGYLFAIYNNKRHRKRHVYLLRFTTILVQELKNTPQKTSKLPPRITLRANRGL